MKLEGGQRLLFIGDSITDCGRSRPDVPSDAVLGRGYVAQVQALLGAKYPDILVEVVNRGISGHRVIDLESRWKRDVLDLKPDWLSVMIGINDVWRHFDSPFIEQVDIDRFRSVYDSLLKRTRGSLQGLVLMTPFYLETNPQDPLRERMDRYGAVVRELASRHDAVFVDTQAAFNAYLEHRPTQSLCGDRVHPNEVGHMILALAFMNAIER